MKKNEWGIIEEKFDIANYAKNETIFAQGNGYIGFRGSFEENNISVGHDGTYINGFYEYNDLKYGEKYTGYPEKTQIMVNVPNSKLIKLWIEDEEFCLETGKIISYKRGINLKKGILKREIIWRSPKLKEIKLEMERIISFSNKHVAIISYKVIPMNFSGTIKILSGIDGDVKNISSKDDPRIGVDFNEAVFSEVNKVIEDSYAMMHVKTNRSNLHLVCTVKNEIKEKEYCCEKEMDSLKLNYTYTIKSKQYQPIHLTKYIVYTADVEQCVGMLEETSIKILNEIIEKGYEKFEIEQSDYLNKMWNNIDICVNGDGLLQQSINFNLFHLLQSVGIDGKTNIAAKGLTGEGYEGHYFWDTETYIFPFFLFTCPEIAEKLLEFRYNTLNNARKQAKQMGHKKGALYPWRTINGDECSSYYPSGTAQYHINADIAFAIKQYMCAVKDENFLINFGAEILFETARVWMEVGFFNERKDGQFCICDVTGPDEYTAVVNNNTYTNLMARENLLYAYETAQWMRKNKIIKYKECSSKIDLKEEEIILWKNAADNMYLPYDKKLKIFPQDDSFLNKPLWDFENTKKEQYPLLMHFHPLTLYRYQVCKQADLILAQFLLSHNFDVSQKKRDYDYYEKITTHDSSLSTCIFSIMANEIGYDEKAYDYFMKTSRIDLDDIQNNTKDGIHCANMAGAWMGIVYGFAGMRMYEDVLKFTPKIPDKWKQYQFSIAYRGNLIGVIVRKNETEYKLRKGSKTVFYHYDSIQELNSSSTHIILPNK